MPKRFRIVARIDPALRKVVGRMMKTSQDHVEHACRDRASGVRRRSHFRTTGEGRPEGTAVRDRDLPPQLDALAKKLASLSLATTRLRRSITEDAQQLVELQGALDAIVRLLRLLRRQREARR